MDKLKLLFVEVFIIFIITSFIGYIYKKEYIYEFSRMLLLLSSYLLFFGISIGTNKISKILTGNYTLKEDVSIETVYNKKTIEFNHRLNQPAHFSKIPFFSSKIPASLYLLISMFLTIILLTFLNIYGFNLLFKLITPALALISIGLALSVVSFNYSKSENFENKKIIFNSARRYFLSSIYAIFSLALLIVIISCRYTLNYGTPLMLDNIHFIILRVSAVLSDFTLWFYVLTCTTSIRFLVEAMILSFKGTVEI